MDWKRKWRKRNEMKDEGKWEKSVRRRWSGFGDLRDFTREASREGNWNIARNLGGGIEKRVKYGESRGSGAQKGGGIEERRVTIRSIVTRGWIITGRFPRSHG
jgi:hypothetical protein